MSQDQAPAPPSASGALIRLGPAARALGVDAEDLLARLRAEGVTLCEVSRGGEQQVAVELADIRRLYAVPPPQPAARADEETERSLARERSARREEGELHGDQQAALHAELEGALMRNDGLEQELEAVGARLREARESLERAEQQQLDVARALEILRAEHEEVLRQRELERGELDCLRSADAETRNSLEALRSQVEDLDLQLDQARLVRTELERRMDSQQQLIDRQRDELADRAQSGPEPGGASQHERGGLPAEREVPGTGLGDGGSTGEARDPGGGAALVDLERQLAECLEESRRKDERIEQLRERCVALETDVATGRRIERSMQRYADRSETRLADSYAELGRLRSELERLSSGGLP